MKLFTCCFILFCTIIFQNHALGQSWLTTFNLTSFHEYATDVIQTPDGGYVVVGNSDSQPGYSGSAVDVLVVKTDLDGNIQWSKVIDYLDQGANQSKRDFVTKVLLNQNGELILAGNSAELTCCNSSAIIWRLNMAGDILSGSPSTGMILKDLIELPSGELIGTGSVLDWQGWQTGYTEQADVVRFDALGNYVDGNYGGWGTDIKDDFGLAILQESQSGNFFVLRGEYKPGQLTTIWLDRLYEDSYYPYESELLGATSYSQKGWLFLTTDYQLVAAYQGAGNGIALTKINPWSGDVAWSSLPAVQSAYFDCMTQTHDGSYVVAGHGAAGILVTKIDGNGIQLWLDTIPMPAGSWHCEAIKETSDHRLVITGFHGSPSGGPSKMFLMKTDSLGNSSPIGGYLGRIKGCLKNDLDGDCTADAGEQPMHGWKVRVEGSAGTYYDVTGNDGRYELQVEPGDYTVSFHHPAEALWNLCSNAVPLTVGSVTDTVVLDNMGQIVTFCPVLDVGITTNFMRPCMENSFGIVSRNYGTETASAVNIEVVFDDGLNVLNASLPFTTTGDTLHFDLGDLHPGASKTIYVKTFLNCAATLGQTFCAQARIMPDNSCLAGAPPPQIQSNSQVCRQATLPLDPNDKMASPAGASPTHEIPNDTTINYTIRFQNTGNDTAFLVVLRDTLSPFLDPASVMPGAASHLYTWDLLGNGVLKFIFDSIQLPDSTVNEPASHGFVNFSIKPFAGLLPGTVVENSAAIYFDFNTPVITNTVFHTIEKPVHVYQEDIAACSGDTVFQVPVLSDTVLYDTVSFALYDSVTVWNVEVLPQNNILLNVFICEGESFLFNGQQLSSKGTYTGVFQNQYGCDSTVALMLAVHPVSESNVEISLCEGEASPLTGTLYSTPGTFTEQAIFQNQYSCDSTVTANVTVHPEELLVADNGPLPYGTLYHGVILTQDTQFVFYDTTEFGCLLTISENVTVGPNAVSDLEKVLHLRVFPNPVKAQFFVEMDLPEAMEISIEIRDLLGRRVGIVAAKEFCQIGKNIFSMDSNQWPNGLYLLHFQFKGKGFFKKIIKQ